MIGAGYNALAGEYGLAWQVVSWLLTVAVELTGLLAGLSLLNQKLIRRLTYSAPVTSLAGSPEEEFSHDSRAVEDQRETAKRKETKLDNEKTFATWLPHPDDPVPAETSQPAEENGETTVTPPSHPPS
jgi:hypothetical protein